MKITALLWHEVIDTLGAKLKQCADMTIYDVRDNYEKRAKDCDKLITWGVKLPPKWYKDLGKPVLYLENALLAQKSGYYMDHKGWFAESSIREFVRPPIMRMAESYFIEKIASELDDHCRSHFGWMFHDPDDPPMVQHSPDGPILFALQNPRDAAFRYYYPCNFTKPEESDWGLGYLRKHHINDRVLVRPHPKFRHRWLEQRDRLIAEGWGERWTEDYHEDPYKLLKACSRLIAVSSTLITEALTLGIPVVALGRGVFSSVDFSSKQSIRDYLLLVFERQLPYNCSVEQIIRHPSWREFIR